MPYTIRKEILQDLTHITDLHLEAFGRDEPIPELVDQLRHIEATFPTLSLVAVSENGAVLGHVMASHGWLDAPKAMVDIRVLSPLGVRPKAQNQGIGTALIERVKKETRALGASLLFLEGNPKYYGPRGFEAAGPLGFRRPSLRIPDAAFQVVRLSEDATGLSGTLIYRDVFWALDCVGLR